MINSDWHIHSEFSYDASNPLELIATNAKNQGLRKVGITDHTNFNDKKFLTDLYNSVDNVKKTQKLYPFVVLGVELTPIEKPQFDYLKNNDTSDGYIPPETSNAYELELAVTKDELKKLGVRYTIGASHWRLQCANAKKMPEDLDVSIKEWYRQQMWLAQDERVTILGHPWWHGGGIWYKDFSIIPHSMNMDIASSLKENNKYVECNSKMFLNKFATEKFKYQYAEFIREFFEMGIKVTYGSDSHHNYGDNRCEVEKYLEYAGFKDGDISEIDEKDLW